MLRPGGVSRTCQIFGHAVDTHHHRQPNHEEVILPLAPVGVLRSGIPAHQGVMASPLDEPHSVDLGADPGRRGSSIASRASILVLAHVE